MTTVALVPAFRRADRVGATVGALVPLVDEVVVVDDGSGDAGATAGAARRAGAKVVVLATNRGKGGALAAGIAATPHATTYLLVDADTAATAAATAPLLAAVAGGADLAIGVLPAAGGRGGFGAVRRVARWGIRRASGFEAAAPLSGQRAARADVLRSLEPADRFGVEAGMTIDAVRTGANVVEVSVEVEHDHTGRGLRGFSHRGRQGWDLVRALWPRLLPERTRIGVLVALAVVATALLAVTGATAVPTGTRLGRAEQVVLVAAPPDLNLQDLDDAARPELAALAGQRGAVAAAHVDVPGRSSWSSWATVGAGAVLRALPPTKPPVPEEPFLVQDLRAGQGRLGDALGRAGRTTAFVGFDPTSPVRLAVADGQGRIGRAATASALGVPGLVNRVRTDLGAGADVVAVDATTLDPAGLEALLAGVRSDDDRRLLLLVTPADPAKRLALRPLVASGPGAPAGRLVSPSTRRSGLVVLSDVAPTILAALAVPVPDGMVGRPLRRLAGPPDVAGLVEADRLARGRNTVWDPALLAIVPLHFASYLWAWRRLRRSGTTGADRLAGTRRRDAVAANPAAAGAEPIAARDEGAAGREAAAPAPGAVALAPGDAGATAAVMSPIAVGADVPGPRGGRDRGAARAGAAAAAAAAAGGEPRVAAPADGDGGHRHDDEGDGANVPPADGRLRRLERRALHHLGLALVAWPLATWVVRAVPGTGSLQRWAGVLAVAVDAGVVALALRIGRGRGLAPLAAVLGATIALVTVDLGLGGPLQLSSAFGGAAHSTGRFTGLGNAAFAVYAASALMAVACARRRAPWMVALLVLVALVDALPSLGGDVGGALSLAPIFAVTVAALWGRLRWRTVLLAGAATAAVLGLALAVDLSRPEDERTHLAGFVTSAGESSSIGGKIGQNLGTYAAVPALAAVVAITVGFALLLWRGRFRHALPPGTPARIGVAAALAVALVGNVLNDSGPIVTLLAMSVIAPSLVVRSVATGDPPPTTLPPAAA